MAAPFAEALARLLSPMCGTCRYCFGPASFLDEDEYGRLGDWYAEAATALTSRFGPPLDPSPRIAEPVDAERVACWRRPDGIAFVLLSWGDGTRVRWLELGLAARGTVFAGCWAAGADPAAASGRGRIDDFWER